MDFNLHAFDKLLKSFLDKNYQFQTFYDFLVAPISKVVILRHDVDRLPNNALQTAVIEHQMGIKGTYYFRVVPESFDLNIMQKIADMGHEIGYHYEDVDLVYRKNYKLIKSSTGKLDLEKLIDLSYESFCKNLENFRKYFDIKTICMHGSPSSKYDNKIIWTKYHYRELGILGEPYFDINYNEFAYFTDTGRRWNGNSFSIRDKVCSKYQFNFKNTQQIINNTHILPDKIMITIHPQRWTDNWVDWSIELISQSIKNIVKYGVIKTREN